MKLALTVTKPCCTKASHSLRFQKYCFGLVVHKVVKIGSIPFVFIKYFSKLFMFMYTENLRPFVNLLISKLYGDKNPLPRTSCHPAFLIEMLLHFNNLTQINSLWKGIVSITSEKKWFQLPKGIHSIGVEKGFVLWVLFVLMWISRKLQNHISFKSFWWTLGSRFSHVKPLCLCEVLFGWFGVFFSISEKYNLIKFLPYIMLVYCFGLQWERSSIIPRVGWYKGYSTRKTIAKVLK